MSAVETPTMKKDTMQTILVSDENYMRLKHFADETGQTIEEMLENFMQQQSNRQQKRAQLEKAVALAQEDYANDPELTAFTALDGEEFYDYDDDVNEKK